MYPMCDQAAKRGLLDASAFIFLLVALSGIATLLRGHRTHPTTMTGVFMGTMGAAATIVAIVFRVVFFGCPSTCCGLLEEDEEPVPTLPSPPPAPPSVPSLPSPPPSPQPPPPPPSLPASPRSSMTSMDIVTTTQL